MGLFSRKSKLPVVESARWLAIGDGSWTYEVVGESHYQQAIAEAVAQYADADERESGRCVLDLGQVLVEPEPSNAYDSGALRVAIDGRTVGYIPKKDAARFAEVCRWWCAVTCPEADPVSWQAVFDARIGWVPDAPDLVYGIKLSLPEGFWETGR